MSKRTPSSHFFGNNFHPQPNVQLQAAQPKKPHAGKHANAKVPKYNKFTLFWHKKSPFSQWHPCRFTVGNVTYNCAEQYMMHQKAVIFGDDRAAWNILYNEDPKEQKKLGRSVQGYDEMTWNGVCEQIVKTANMAKFSQNPKLYQELLKTAGTELAEASPFDRKWGIGLGPNNPKANDRSQWRGGNLLGRIITEVRDELMKNSGEMHSALQQPMMPSNNYPSSKGEGSKNTNRPNQQSLSIKSPNAEKERTGSRFDQKQRSASKESRSIKDDRKDKDYSEQRPSEEPVRHHGSKTYQEADEHHSTSNRSRKRKFSEYSDKHSHDHHREKSSHKKRRESHD